MVNQYSEIFECFFCLENFNCRTLVSKSETQLISEIADSIKVKNSTCECSNNPYRNINVFS